MAADWKKMQAKFEVWLAKITDGPSLDPDADDVALIVIAALSSLFDEVAHLKKVSGNRSMGWSRRDAVTHEIIAALTKRVHALEGQAIDANNTIRRLVLERLPSDYHNQLDALQERDNKLQRRVDRLEELASQRLFDIDAPQRVDRDALNRQRVTQVAKRFVREARTHGTEGWTMGLLDRLHELECALENERP